MSAAHHDDGHEAFDPEPIAEIGADETPSPGWLPIVGAVLFTLGVGWVFYPGSDAIAKAPEPAPSASAAKAAAKPAADKPAPRPAGSGKGPLSGKGITKGAIKKLPTPKKP
jgi:hypothetical protein